MEFKLNGTEFIPLNALLKMMNVAESGGQANMFITDGEVTVNGEVETAKRKKMRPGDTVVALGETIAVQA
ncbi:MAG: ribosome-associated protein [Salibacteraceae bacterium]|jgi:ribosome-associated protein